MKTEQEYADELVEKYEKASFWSTTSESVQCALIDVQNTIYALEEQVHYVSPKLAYYQEVKRILENR